MAFDGLFIKKLINETTPFILNKKVNKIYSSKDHFYFKLGEYFLTFNLSKSNSFFYISNKSLNNFNNEFLKTLKIYLNNTKLISINQKGYDRIIKFTFLKFDKLFGSNEIYLYFEAFGKDSNLILVNSDNKIIDAYLKNPPLDLRTILPGFMYEDMKGNKENPLNINYDNINEFKDIVKNYEGISPLVARYLFSTRKNLETIKINPTKNLDNNKFYWFNLFDNKNIENFNSLSDLLLSLEENKIIDKRKINSFLTKKRNKEVNKLSDLKEDLKRNKELLSYKEYADKIYSSNLNLKKKYSHFKEIKLNLNKTLNENAQNFYDIYKKASSSFIPINKEIKITKNKIDLFNEHLQNLKYINEQTDLEELEKELLAYGYKPKNKQLYKNKKNIPNILTITLDDAKIYVGKNNIQNEYIISNIANKDDMWFHVKNYSGGHVILKGNKSSKNILICANLACFYSSQKNSSNIFIDYTYFRYVSKIRKQPAYKVKYTNYKTMVINIDLDLLSNLFVC